MVRRLLLAALVVASLACVVQDAQAAGACKGCRGKGVLNYLFGGYGPGPFGNGQVSYAGHPPICNTTNCGRPIR
jgi:hypothetical protein